jgi:hypothetical protein
MPTRVKYFTGILQTIGEAEAILKSAKSRTKNDVPDEIRATFQCHTICKAPTVNAENTGSSSGHKKVLVRNILLPAYSP